MSPPPDFEPHDMHLDDQSTDRVLGAKMRTPLMGPLTNEEVLRQFNSIYDTLDRAKDSRHTMHGRVSNAILAIQADVMDLRRDLDQVQGEQKRAAETVTRMSDMQTELRTIMHVLGGSHLGDTGLVGTIKGMRDQLSSVHEGQRAAATELIAVKESVSAQGETLADIQREQGTQAGKIGVLTSSVMAQGTSADQRGADLQALRDAAVVDRLTVHGMAAAGPKVENPQWLKVVGTKALEYATLTVVVWVVYGLSQNFKVPAHVAPVPVALPAPQPTAPAARPADPAGP